MNEADTDPGRRVTDEIDSDPEEVARLRLSRQQAREGLAVRWDPAAGEFYVCPQHVRTGGYESCCACGGWEDGDPDYGRICTEAGGGNAAEPAELVRPARTVVVDMNWNGTLWIAASDQVDGFGASGKDRKAVERAVRKDLAEWLDPAVTLEFRETSGNERS